MNEITQVYFKDGRWVGFFISARNAGEWINQRDQPGDFKMEVGKPRDTSVGQTSERFPTRAEADEMRKASIATATS